MNKTKASPQSRALSHLVQVVILLTLWWAWYGATRPGGLSPMVMPSPGAVWRDFVAIVGSGQFVPHMLVTLGTLAVAFSATAIIGLVIGFLCSRTGYRVKVFDPLFSSLYAIPSILLYPIFVLLFGIGVGSKIALGMIVAFFPVVIATIAAISNVDRIYRVAALSMGATPAQTFFHVLLPAALPVIASGLRIGVIQATGAILAGETLSSFAGLGHQIVSMADQFRLSGMYAYILIAILISLTINLAALYFERRLHRHVA